MTIVKDDNLSVATLAIVEKYEGFRNYMYPILQRSPREHGVLRDVVIAALFEPIGALYHAAKSKQVSRLYDIDAEKMSLKEHVGELSGDGVSFKIARSLSGLIIMVSQDGTHREAVVNLRDLVQEMAAELEKNGKKIDAAEAA